ncbi:MAG: SDR family NAD(P)-dependent oxidoreductase, partial [Thiohalocapsa sp.]
MARPLAGRHAIVTGAGRGIGAAIADRLAALGAGITLVGRTAKTLETARAKLEAAHGVPTSIAVADVTDATAVAQAFAAAAKALGTPAILVNNAGAAASAPFKRTDLALWQRMIDVNLTSVFLCTQAVLPAMVEAGYGRIVSVASTAGLTGYRY